jgi:hypothetical protein
LLLNATANKIRKIKEKKLNCCGENVDMQNNKGVHEQS